MKTIFALTFLTLATASCCISQQIIIEDTLKFEIYKGKVVFDSVQFNYEIELPSGKRMQIKDKVPFDRVFDFTDTLYSGVLILDAELDLSDSLVQININRADGGLLHYVLSDREIWKDHVYLAKDLTPDGEGILNYGVADTRYINSFTIPRKPGYLYLFLVQWDYYSDIMVAKL